MWRPHLIEHFPIKLWGLLAFFVLFGTMNILSFFSTPLFMLVQLAILTSESDMAGRNQIPTQNASDCLYRVFLIALSASSPSFCRFSPPPPPPVTCFPPVCLRVSLRTHRGVSPRIFEWGDDSSAVWPLANLPPKFPKHSERHRIWATSFSNLGVSPPNFSLRERVPVPPQNLMHLFNNNACILNAKFKMHFLKTHARMEGHKYRYRWVFTLRPPLSQQSHHHWPCPRGVPRPPRRCRLRRSTSKLWTGDGGPTAPLWPTPSPSPAAARRASPAERRRGLLPTPPPPAPAPCRVVGLHALIWCARGEGVWEGGGGWCGGEWWGSR